MSWMKDLDTEVEEAVEAFECTSGTRMTAEAKTLLADRMMARAIAQAAPAANLTEKVGARANDLISHPSTSG